MTARLLCPRALFGLAASLLAVALVAAAQAAGAPLDVNCASQDFHELKMEQNLRAATILVDCGKAPGGGNLTASQRVAGPSNPFDLGGGDINLITGAETSPRVTQSEDMVWAQGNTIVVAYNDSRGGTLSPQNFAGASVSIDGGQTFSRLSPSPFTGLARANFGDPVVVYNAALAKWFAGFLATGDCGTIGGIGMWQSSNGTTWTTAPCAHVNSTGQGDDRQALAVDNDPASAHFGRMYMVWNNFATGQGPLVESFSDNGSTWSSPVTIDANTLSFTRDTGVTVANNGTLLVYGLNEATQGGAKTYKLFRSTDGGLTYVPTVNMAAAQAAPGQTGGGTCGTNQNIPPIWRYEGNGQLAVSGGQVLGYDYTRGDAGDQGNIYFVRSTDNGLTWGPPLKLNTDAGTRAQWMPALAATSSGNLVASWYDRRNTSTNDYQRFATVSNDGGVTWGPDEPVSDVVIPQPGQPDPSIISCYAGDYNLDFGSGDTVFDAWTDGRVPISPGGAQQDVFLDTINAAAPTAVTNVATGVGVHTATLNGVANDNSDAGTAHFEWGNTAAYGQDTPTVSLAASASDQPLSAALSGLAPATTYHFRLDVQNSHATDNGGDQQFTTAALAHHRITAAKSGLGSGSVASADGAINCGSTCTHVYQDEDSVTLTPTADAGSVFSGWFGGGCSGTGPCTIQVGSDQMIDAIFKPSSAFRFKKPVLNKKKGTAILPVVLPDSGDLSLAGRGIKPIAKRRLGQAVARGGLVKLKLKPTGKTKRRLRKKHKAKVKANVTFTVTDGDPVTQTKKLKLIRKR